MITIIAPRDYTFLHTLPNMAINQSEIAPALNPARSCLVGSRTSTRALHFPALGFSLTVQYTDPCEISFQISPPSLSLYTRHLLGRDVALLVESLYGLAGHAPSPSAPKSSDAEGES